MAKIGIITMHKVLNYGSALQAYALQKVLEDMGHNVEIIDYIFPNKYHNQFRIKPPLYRRLLSSFFNVLRGNPYSKKKRHFDDFYKKYLTLSQTYYSPQALKKAPPRYDIYITGSDQVWNPKSIYGDTSFMLDFIDSPHKIAFSSSFSTSNIPACFVDIYAKELRKYKYIYMREKSGCDLIRRLVGMDSDVVLDPTLLLNRRHWLSLVDSSNLNIDEPYMLVYILGYSFDAYPYMFDLVKEIQKKTGLLIVVLSMSNQYAARLNNKRIIHNASVIDFVKLFAGANLVITDSFHGTAFSLNLQVPFYSVVNDDVNDDSRILNLLNLTGENHRAIKNLSDFSNITIDYKLPSIKKLEVLRNQSIDFLKKSLI